MTPIQLPSSTPPIMLVVIDTEEEFDWNGEFSRDATDVSAIREILPLQELFDEFGIRPTYVVDYPIATRPESVDTLGEFLSADRAELGIHLHSWVNPPFEEDVNHHNSYQGNLPENLERAKLEQLREAFETSFGFFPRVHKAGRYGFGPNTAAILEELGIEVDLSVAPAFDFRQDGGPDYSRNGADVFWHTERLLGIPTTGSFIGPLRKLGASLYSASSQNHLPIRLASRVLSRTRLVERIMLSPEGHSLDKLVRLTHDLMDTGQNVVTFSFHSSSVRPGATTYIHTESDLKDFIVRCRQYFEFFLGTLNGVPMTATQVHELVTRTSIKAI